MQTKSKQKSKKNNASDLYIPRRFTVSNSIFDIHATEYAKNKHEGKADNSFNAFKKIKKLIPHFIAFLSASAAIMVYFATDQSMRISNRAFLLAEALNAKINSDSTVTIHYSIKNYGNSPARKTKVTIGCSVLKNFTDTLAYHANDTAKISYPVPPGKTISDTVVTSSKISKTNMQLYLADSAHVYAYGVVEYIDMFDEKHYSYFCGEIIKGKDALDLCPGYNDMK